MSTASSSSGDSVPLIDKQKCLNYLRKLMKMFTKGDLLQSLKSFTTLQLDAQRSKQSKAKLIDDVLRSLDLTSEGLFDLAVNLDMTSLVRYLTKKSWKVYLVNEATAAHLTAKDEIEFQDAIYKTTSFQNDILSVHCCTRKSAFWFRIAYLNKKKQITCSYLIYFPGYPYIFLSGILKQLETRLFQVFLKLLKGESIEPFNLHGSDIFSLLQLAIQKTNGAVIENPNQMHIIGTERKRIHDDKVGDQDVDLILGNVIDLEEARKLRIKEYCNKTFGVFEPPILTSSKFWFDTRFYGRNEVSEEKFKMDMTIKGKSIIRSVREMIETGVVSEPIPKMYEQLAISGCNNYMVTDNR